MLRLRHSPPGPSAHEAPRLPAYKAQEKSVLPAFPSSPASCAPFRARVCPRRPANSVASAAARRLIAIRRYAHQRRPAE